MKHADKNVFISFIHAASSLFFKSRYLINLEIRKNFESPPFLILCVVPQQAEHMKS